MASLNIAVIGIGYVGLPLAASLSKYNKVIGFDTSKKRINDLKKYIDSTKEFNSKKLKKLNKLSFTFNSSDLENSNIFFVTVPTPINFKKKPDLSYLIQATKIVAKYIKKKTIVVYESTVYPGCTEEVCLPILEKLSNLKLNKDFYLAYSPERINPGKSKYKLNNTIKVIGSSNKKALNLLSEIYKKICLNVHTVSGIKTAEAAKIIENTQRDLNIALVNELSIIFKKMDLDINKVLEAASTKWNFAKFEPGLVGGHCIGVDPYYLTYKSEKLKYKPKVILAGRKINDSMGIYVAKNIIKFIKNSKIKSKKILILGATFKENCSDLRNSKIFDTIRYLEKRGAKVYVYDPLIAKNILSRSVKKVVTKLDKKYFYDVAVIATKHDQFIKMGTKSIKKNIKRDGLIFDLKSIYPTNQTDWRL